MMERVCIKQGLSGFPLAVIPIQEVFSKECDNRKLDADVLQFFSELQKELIIDMTIGAAAISRRRGTEDIAAEDLLCYLRINWKEHPLLLTEDYYEVSETTEKRDPFRPREPPPKRRRRRRRASTNKTASIARKLAAEALKELKKEAHKRTLDICRAVVFKTPFPPPLKETELKVETPPCTDIMCRPDIIEFFGKQRRIYSFSCIPEPSLVPPIYKSKKKVVKKNSKKSKLKAKSELKSKSEFKAERQLSIDKSCPDLTVSCENKRKVCSFNSSPEQTPVVPTLKSNPKVKKKFSKKSGSELKAERPPSIDLMSRPDIIEFFGKKRKVYSFNIPEPYPVAPTYEFNKEAEEEIERVFFGNETIVYRFASTYKSTRKVKKQTSIRERSIKVLPSKKSVERQTHPDLLTISIHGTKQDVSVSDAASRKSIEGHTYKTKSKVDEKSKKVVSFKEKTEPSIEMSPGSDSLVTRLPGFKDKLEISGVDAVLKQSHEAPKCKPNSKVNVKTALCENLMRVSQFKEKMEQIFKIPQTKGKQLAGINCGTSVETPEIERQPSIDIPHPDSQVPKIPRKKRKREVSDVADVPTESREAARKKLAIILLRIAGKY